MQLEDTYELGHIVKPHGLQGELNVFFDTDEPEKYLELESVYLNMPGGLEPYHVEHVSPHQSRFLVKLEDIDSIEQAETLRNVSLHLPLSELPELPDGRFYYHQIIGYTVVDEQQGELGTVEEVYPDAVHPLLSMRYEGKEVLVPLQEEIVLRADNTRQLLHVNLPEGLVDVYLKEDEEEAEES